MRIKIFTPNEYGRIELTKEELEKLLNESYQQGWNDKPYYGSYRYYPAVTYCSNSTNPYEIRSTLKTANCADTATAECINGATNCSATSTLDNASITNEIKSAMENTYKVELK